MSDVIKLLSEAVANQIAAGEVIQRPASVIKELVENAVDAGATKIDVFITDAGRTAIQVIDNGKGMSATDARMAFERHATSKIRAAEDLFTLSTMGFRGEALASIAAVAQVELKTRRNDDEIGTSISITASQIENQEPIACAVGCNFLVKNLFFNVPARRRFLKSNYTELSNIITAFERIALVYPNIAFTLSSNGTLLQSLSQGNLRKRIADIAGKKVDQYLLPINVDTSLVKIYGFVGKPESAKKKGAQQNFFVNGRYMRHPYFHKAVLNAYERLIPIGEQPLYYIYLEIDAKDIDVNIHPVKTEIKFENEQSVFQILMAGVREALGTFCQLPTLNLSEQIVDTPVYNPTKTPKVIMQMKESEYNPFLSSHEKKVPNEWQQLYHNPQQPKETYLFDTPYSLNDDAPELKEKSPTHYQYKGMLIMTAVKSGLMLVDQHRAHVRILYEHLLAMRSHALLTTSQKVIFPEVIDVSKKEALFLDSIFDTLIAMGFEIQHLGGESYSITALPAGLKDIDVNMLVRKILDNTETPNSEDIISDVVLRIAQISAIPTGQILSNEEMENVVNELFACSNVNYTPDGKRIFAILPQMDIESLFRK